MTAYLVVAAAVVLALLVFGVPMVTRMVKIPGRLQWEPIPAGELSEAAAACFNLADPPAAELGFSPLVNFRVPGLGQGNENRLYVCPEKSASLTVSLLAAGGKRQQMFELVTAFADGVIYSTSNAQLSGLFDQPAWHRSKQFPGLTDLGRLHEAHQRRVAEYRATGAIPKPLAADSLLDDMIASQHRQLEYQAERGLFRFNEKNGMYEATAKVALRGVASFLNPLADNFTLGRFALGFGGGLALAAAAVKLAGPLGLEVVIRSGFPAATAAQVNFLSYAPGFILSGGVVGWVFRDKGFLWGFVLSLPAIFLLPEWVSQPIYYSFLAAWSGRTAGRLRESREDLGMPAQAGSALIILGVLLAVGFYFVN